MPNDDDIFANVSSDHTQIFPMPGGNREDAQRKLQEEKLQQPHIEAYSASSQTSFHGQEHSRTLVGAATNLLLLIAHISNTLDAKDTNALKQQISEEINHFEVQCKRLGIDKKSRDDAKYILCTALDEAVLNTPWGNQSNWSMNTLLSSYFRDVQGGQIFFEKMRSLGDDPQRNHQVLQLMYYCLALGYQGRYRTEPDSIGKLTHIRQWLGEKIRENGFASGSADLSPHWKGIHGLGFSLKDFLPLWLVGLISAVLLAGVFSGFLYFLKDGRSVVVDRLNKIDLVATPIALAELDREDVLETKATEPLPELEFGEGGTVIKGAGSTKIRIEGDYLFASGKSSVNSKLVPALTKLAKELNARSGQIIIIGHTDNLPIRSIRLKNIYGSNQGLSEARAKSVAKIMSEFIEDKNRISTMGKGALEPLVDNLTKESRSKNRRVEIEIVY